VTTDVEEPDETPTPDAAAESEVEVAPGGPLATRSPAREELTTRFILPLVIPVCAVFGVAIIALNVGNVFLAGGRSGSLIAGTLITLGILSGASWISAHPKLRTSSLTVIVVGIVFLATMSGLLTYGAARPKGEAAAPAYVQPKGEPDFTLEVDALPELKFQAKEFAVPAGILGLNYVDKGGTHTLVFEDAQYTGFKLAVPDGPTKGQVDIAPGDYVIYCTIAGHRAAGMEATIKVTAGAPPAS
jgi:plastocyanin